ncbi:hypothetical protein HRW07_32895, partial [Streptomyces lunaelactis]|nr:hypothetical protein [Streptomyces lunaelactis]
MKLRLRAYVGDAVLIPPKGEPDRRALAFAERLARDVQNTLVVIDLPAGAVDRECEAVARLLSRDRYGTLRLVFGRGTREEIRTAGQRIADRLAREVLVPDGRVVPTLAGGLFIPSDQGDGWLRCRPGRPAQRDSRRFPKPHWEFSTPARPLPTGTHTVAEPVPGGVWVRDIRTEPSAAHRKRLVEDLPTHPDLLLVIVGSPGAPAVGLDDLARFWDTVLPNARAAVRFVLYGAVDVPAAVAPGQEMANALGHPVVLCAGLPAGAPGSGDMEVSAGDATPGRRPYADELSYVPVRAGHAPPPALSGLRPPLDGVPEIATGLYQYAPDAVLEVVQSGLWLRPPAEPPGANDIRRVPAAPGHAILHVDRGAPQTVQTAERMLALAEDIRQRLCAGTGADILLAPTEEPSALVPLGGANGPAPTPLGTAPAAAAPPAGRPAPALEHPAPLPPLPATEAGALTSAALTPPRTRLASGDLASVAPRIRGGASVDPEGVPVGPAVRVPPVRGGTSGRWGHPQAPAPARRGARRPRPGDSVPPPTEPAAPPRPADPEPASAGSDGPAPAPTMDITG